MRVDVIFFRDGFLCEVERFCEPGHDGGNLFHSVCKFLVGARFEIVGHQSIDIGHHFHQFHTLATFAQYFDQRADKPRAVHIIAPGKITWKYEKIFSHNKNFRHSKIDSSLKKLDHMEMPDVRAVDVHEYYVVCLEYQTATKTE